MGFVIAPKDLSQILASIAQGKVYTQLLTLDLSISRSNVVFSIQGSDFTFFDADNDALTVGVTFNELTGPMFTLSRYSSLSLPYVKFFLSNSVQTGTAEILVGMGSATAKKISVLSTAQSADQPPISTGTTTNNYPGIAQFIWVTVLNPGRKTVFIYNTGSSNSLTYQVGLVANSLGGRNRLPTALQNKVVPPNLDDEVNFDYPYEKIMVFLKSTATDSHTTFAVEAVGNKG